MAAPLRAAVEILRPLNAGITLGSVLLATWLGVHTVTWTGFVAAVSATFIAGFGNSHNDVHDVHVDAFAHPLRPIPSSRLSLNQAKVIAGVCAALGFLLSLFLPSICTLLAAMTVGALWTYNRFLKWWPLAGNALIAGIAATAFVYGGYAVGTPRAVLPISIFAFLLHFAREVVKDIQDMAADSKAGGPTLPALLGLPKTRAIVTTLLGLLCALTPLPATLGSYGPLYMSLIGLLDLFILAGLVDLWAGRNDRASALLKTGMIVGLAAFVAGGSGG